MMMRILFIIILLASCSPAKARESGREIPAPQKVALKKADDRLSVKMVLNLNDLHVASDRAVLLTPMLVNGGHRKPLPAVGIYGRNRYIHYLRKGGMLSGEEETSFKASQTPETLRYDRSVAWEAWMDGAVLELRRNDYGCCRTLLATQTETLRTFGIEKPFEPRLAYVRPAVEKVKSRLIAGRAFVDFPVDLTEIKVGYRANARELAKIVTTIDSVKNDPDITVKSVTIKGFASPEGSYAHNERLAKGRTVALKNYVDALYGFAPEVVKVAFEAEDWEGLRERVDRSELPDRARVIAIIDSGRTPDEKERALKTTCPETYRLLLADVFPALRRSDYVVEFEVRGFTDVDEIERLAKSRPQKLSLDEFYLAAERHEPGSDDFDELFETAVRMYPDDAVANLNAANAALSRGDTERALRYLDKAGDRPEADYARGVAALGAGDRDAAVGYMKRALQGGVTQAEEALKYLEREDNF